MKLEDKAYEDWKAWAIKETAALKLLSNSAYSGNEEEENVVNEEEGSADMEALEESLVGSR